MKLNPVFKNEVKLSSRTVKTSWMVFSYNAALLAVSLTVFCGMLEWAHYGSSVEYSEMVQMYMIMGYMEFGMILLIIPAITSGSIAGERERQTLDILLATKMRPISVVMGKLMASLSSVLMLAVSSLPVLSIVFVYGGVGVKELLAFVVILCVSAVFVGSIGIFFSALCRRTTAATVASYLATIFLLAGTSLAEGAVYEARQMQIAASGVGEAVYASVGKLIYLLLVNPAVTFYGLISAQAGSSDAIWTLCLSFGVRVQEFGTQYWVLLSVCLQLLLSGLLLWLAARKIDPLK